MRSHDLIILLNRPGRFGTWQNLAAKGKYILIVEELDGCSVKSLGPFH